MWVMLNDCFLSIVKKDGERGDLLVRARRPGDIEKIFPGVAVSTDTTTDYRYRAHVDRGRVADAIANEVMAINYPNFKDSVSDKPLHDAYVRVWTAMASLQPGGAFGRGLFDPPSDPRDDYEKLFEPAPRGRRPAKRKTKR